MSEFGLRVNSPQVIHETIDGEVIIINLTSGTYYSLKGSGAELWEIIHRSPGVRAAQIIDAVAPLHATSRSDIEASIAQFVGMLRDEGLVGETEPAAEGLSVSSTHGATVGNGADGAFEVPKLEKYTDMQDLVLLDPVHQVDETGWPQPNPDVAERTNG